ncbi:ATP-binding protein [Agrococcus sp. ARC_14]|uniref:AAA family ATPase n=1 Tax=Agrococcus sp. ARC_14 TaxID=2919927 RepID=UPI001F065D8D|nr:ATP-binding protein [Agrococcus sp. ARC_14]MCH1883710.1 ATP-binding protein [Agrococcus sp. ARC_14]
MAEVTLLCGPAGAGKTTLARELEASGALVLSYDREAWARGVRDGRPTQALMHEIDDDFHRQIADAVAADRHVVLDASLSTRAVRDRWRMRCGAMGVPVTLVVVRAPLETLAQRVAEREPGPESVVVDPQRLRDYVAGFEWPGAHEVHRTVDTA